MVTTALRRLQHSPSYLCEFEYLKKIKYKFILAQCLKFSGSNCALSFVFLFEFDLFKCKPICSVLLKKRNKRNVREKLLLRTKVEGKSKFVSCFVFFEPLGTLAALVGELKWVRI